MSGYILCVAIGIVCGVVIGFVIFHFSNKTIGTLRVDQSDPYDNPYLFLELDTNVDDIKKQKRVTLKVNASNYISQK